MLGADVGVKAVGQRIVDCANMSPGAAGGFEHDDLVAALH